MANNLIVNTVSRPHLVGTSSDQGSNTAKGAVLITPGTGTGTPAISEGCMFNIAAATFTDEATAASGTATAFAAYALQRPTLAAEAASVTTTSAATLYIANAPAAGTNQTLTNAYALWVDAGAVKFDGALSTGGQLTLASGTAGAPGLAFTSDASLDSGLYLIGANNIGLTLAGTKSVDFAANLMAVTGAMTTTTSITAGNALTVTAGVLTLPVGLVGTPSLIFAGDTNTGLYQVAADRFGIAAGGALVLDVNGTTGSADTGISIVSQAAGSGIRVSTRGTNAAEDLFLDAKGTGILTLGSIATGGTKVSSPAVAAGVDTLTLVPGAHTAVVAEKSDLIASAHTNTITGSYATQRFNRFMTPTISAASALTVTTAATLYVEAAPAVAASAVITNSYALWVDAGDIRADNNIWTGTPAAFATTQPTGSHVFLGTLTAPVGAITQSSAIFASTTVMRKIIADGTASNIET